MGLGSWSSKWTLPFNLSKFAHVEFCLCNSLPHADYSMNGVPIPSCGQHKDLGIILSHDLSWSHHYHYILCKAYSKLGMVRRSFSPLISIKVKKNLYVSLIRSQILYGSQLWRPKFIRDIVKVEQLQRRASKFILHDFSSNYKTRLLSLDLLPLMMMFELNDVLFFINCLKNPSESFDIFKYVSPPLDLVPTSFVTRDPILTLKGTSIFID